MFRKLGKNCKCRRWNPGFTDRCIKCGQLKLSDIICECGKVGLHVCSNTQSTTVFINNIRVLIGLRPIPQSPIPKKKKSNEIVHVNSIRN